MVLGVIHLRGRLPEEIHLAADLVDLEAGPDLHRLLQAGHHLVAVAAQPVERAGLDQGLDHLLVDRPQVHVLAEMEQALEPPELLAGLDDVLDRLFARRP